MRSRKLGPAIAAAATLLALAPQAALAAHRNRSHRTHGQTTTETKSTARCRLSIVAEPHLLTSGESAQLFGQLTCPGNSAAAASQTVTVYERPTGKSTVTVLGTPSTGPTGFYSIVASSLSANTYFYASAGGLRSANQQIRVAPVVKLNGPGETKQLFTGTHHAVEFNGTVSPSQQGALVVLQRENANGYEEWHSIGRSTVASNGEFKIRHTFVVPGDADLRVVVRSIAPRVTERGVSNTLNYTVSQTEHPNLTLNASSFPISIGESLKLEGTLKDGANQTVTLYSHGAQGSFASIATTKTDGSGHYSFEVSPSQNTAYKVTDGHTSSAVLYEGVKNVLTASVSATSVKSGQSLTFSGTVKPADIGHVIYLERQNAYSGGFHVVDVATVTAGASSSEGAYSITDPIFGSGKAVLRVKIPGDHINQAASSSPFTIEVTAANAETLHPFAPNKLPSEGQI